MGFRHPKLSTQLFVITNKCRKAICIKKFEYIQQLIDYVHPRLSFQFHLHLKRSESAN